MTDKNETEGAMAEARELMRRTEFVYLSSLDDEGLPETRVLFNLLKHRAEACARGPAALDPAGFASYIGTNASSRKAAQLREDGRCHLYFSDNASYQGFGLKGKAVEVLDPAIRAAVYAESWDMYYPGGRDGGDFLLLRFEPEAGRYYHGLRVVEFGARPEKRA